MSTLVLNVVFVPSLVLSVVLISSLVLSIVFISSLVLSVVSGWGDQQGQGSAKWGKMTLKTTEMETVYDLVTTLGKSEFKTTLETSGEETTL